MEHNISILGDKPKKGRLDEIMARGDADLKRREQEERRQALEAEKARLNARNNPKPEPASMQSSEKLAGSYDWVKAPTYGKAMKMLRDSYSNSEISRPLFTQPDGSKIIRPLTFKETIEARVNAYNSGKTDEEKKKLFGYWFSTSTGIAYKANSDRFKIIPICPELIKIDEEFNESFLPCDYSSLGGVELDRKAKYDQGLAKPKVLGHLAWLAAVEGDKTLLKEYAGIVFDGLKINPAMSFYLVGDPKNPPKENQLRALGLIRDYDSSADGDYLDNVARFLRMPNVKGTAGGGSQKTGGSK